MKTFAFIFARGGSKGLPGKNLRSVGDKSLLAHSIVVAQSLDEVDEIFVSTDSDDIAQAATALGVEVIRRSIDLAGDNSPEWQSWQHAIKWAYEEREQFDRFLSLPPTAPLRDRSDVQAALDRLDADTDFVITMTDSHRNPWFNMVAESGNGLKRVIEPAEPYAQRQDAPQSFDMTTVAFVGRPDFIVENLSIWDGRLAGVTVPAGRAVDIDTEFDLQFAEFLWSKSRGADDHH